MLEVIINIKDTKVFLEIKDKDKGIMVEATANLDKALALLTECEQSDILTEYGKRSEAEKEAFAG